MGNALYMPPFTMPFVATPFSSTAAVTPDLLNRIDRFMNMEAHDAFGIEGLVRPREHMHRLIDTSLSWRVGLQRFSTRDLPTPMLPPPPDAAQPSASSADCPDILDLDGVFMAVEDGDADAVAHLDPGRAAELLKELVHDVEHPLRVFDAGASPEIVLFQAIELLGTAAGEDAAGVLCDALAHRESTQPELIKAIVGIHFLRIIEAAPMVLQVLERRPIPRGNDGSDPVRIAAIHALGNIGNLGALAPLSVLATGTGVSERGSAIEAAGNIVMRVLTQRDEESAARDPEFVEHSALGHALVTWFISYVETVGFDAAEHPAVRGVALDALGKVGNGSHFEPLMQLIKRFIDDDDFVDIDARHEPEDLDRIFKGAIAALGWLGDPRADASIITIAKDMNEEFDVRREALETLCKLGSASALSALEQIAMDARDPLHREAERLLRDLVDDEPPDIDLG